MTAFAAFCVAGAAIAQTQNAEPAMPASSMIARGENWSYFKPDLSLTKYRSIILDPTVVYSGADAQFEDIEPADRQAFANILTDEINTELAKSFPLVQKPAPDVARLKVTLLGAQPTKVGVTTATQVLPIGIALNAVKSISGKSGRNAGSVLYAVELLDSSSGELLAAAVRRETPDALDLPASLGTKETVKAVGQSMGKRFREKLETATGRGG
jgi:hypothetical protein